MSKYKAPRLNGYRFTCPMGCPFEKLLNKSGSGRDITLKIVSLLHGQ